MTPSKLRVFKMHGAGNDFVLLDHPDLPAAQLPDLAVRLCDRRFGIGADGILILSDSDCADAKMNIYNADGSEAEMCGNGIRCIGKYLYDNNVIKTTTPTIETLAGVKPLVIHPDNTNTSVCKVSVDMGEAKLSHGVLSMRLSLESGEYNITPVSVGNPHGVVIVDNLENLPFATLGPQLESHPIFPDKANIEFVKIDSKHSVTQQTWERGVGETLACGTGACATAFALCSAGLTEWPVTVRLKGGDLTIDLDPATGHLIMTGEACTVFSTEITL